jgi:hypothetical protein
MRDFIMLFIHVMVTVVRLAGSGTSVPLLPSPRSSGINCSSSIADASVRPNLGATDRVAAGLLTLLISPARILRSAIVLKASTFLHLHNLLRKRKYRISLTENASSPFHAEPEQPSLDRQYVAGHPVRRENLSETFG